MPFEIKIEGLERLQKGVQEMGIKLNRDSEIMMDQIGEGIKRQMAENAPSSTGYLASHISVKERRPGLRVIGPMGEAERYAGAIEEGNRPHWPRYSPNRVFSLGARYGYDERLSYVVAKRLSTRSGQASRFVRKTYEWARGFFEQEVQSMIQRIVGAFK